MKPNRVIDLSFSRKLELVGHTNINWELLFECAYYPSPICSQCTFNNPNTKCSHSHILIDTRVNPPKWQPAITNKKTRVQRKFSLEELLSQLTKEEAEEVKQLIERKKIAMKGGLR